MKRINKRGIKMSNRKKFEMFQKNNEHVLFKLIELCELAVSSGRTKLSMNYSLKTHAQDFKLCNNYRAYFTRLIRKLRPELGNLITSRGSKADYDETN